MINVDLDDIWKVFISLLQSNQLIDHADWKKAAGIPFVYIRPKITTAETAVEKAILLASSKAMKGKQLHSETLFVRREINLLVYRHRFYVPQKKMFCCGNLCADCVRFDYARF